jgi:hypothetical protein
MHFQQFVLVLRHLRCSVVAPGAMCESSSLRYGVHLHGD